MMFSLCGYYEIAHTTIQRTKKGDANDLVIEIFRVPSKIFTHTDKSKRKAGRIKKDISNIAVVEEPFRGR